MAFVLDVSPIGAIDSYTDLVAELRDLQDNADYDIDAIARAVRKAEAYFMRRLRLADMEVTTTLAVDEATAELPTDCRELRSVVWLGANRDYPLSQTSLASLSAAYGGQAGAYPAAYAREGTTLRFAPVVSGTARIVYYADLAPLSDAYPTNWLLLTAPDLYIAGAQYYLCRRERDGEGEAKSLAEMTAIIDSMNDEAARRGGGNLVPYGMAQVFGSRA